MSDRKRIVLQPVRALPVFPRHLDNPPDYKCQTRTYVYGTVRIEAPFFASPKLLDTFMNRDKKLPTYNMNQYICAGAHAAFC